MFITNNYINTLKAVCYFERAEVRFLFNNKQIQFICKSETENLSAIRELIRTFISDEK